MREDWIECELIDVVTYSKGKKPKLLVKDITKDINIPYINIKAFEKGIYSEYTDGIKCNLCEEGDLLMVWDGARAGLTGRAKKGAVGSTLMKIEPINRTINKEFLFYYLLSKYVLLNTNPRGVGIPHVEPRLLWNSKFLIPGYSIQKAIVKKTEELFSSLDSGIADLKKAQGQLVIYRQAVLKKAFEGELTNSKQKSKGLPDGWKSETIREVCKNVKVGIVIKPTNFYSESKNGIKAFRSANVREFKINDTNWVYFSEEGNQINKRTQVHTGDVLLVRSGYPGTSCVVTETYNNTNAIDILIATPNQKKILPDFLCAFNNSPLGKGLFSRGSQGVAQKHLNVGVYGKLHISYPTIKEQREILKEIESRLSVCDKVEESIKESLQKATALRQSILKKAFEGTLLSEEEIAKCKADKDYEPASVLLEKIRAEKLVKNTTTKKSKPNKKKTITKKPPVPQKISTDIQAGVIAKVIQLHESNPEHLAHLSHVKCEKISHLVECHLQIPLGRVPVKDAAGPDDYNHLKKVEHRAGMAGYFKVVKKEIGHSYSSSRNIAKAIENLESKITAEQKKQLDNLINLFLKFDLERAEIIATLYAGWNNLIIEGKIPTDDEIVYESRENWSKRKLTIKKERFYMALQWMRKDDISLIPIGFGTKVLKPNKQK